MAAKKVIVVVGATGRQGSSVVNTFLGLSNWHVRAMTRNPSSETAQALNTRGVEVVKADLADPASLTTAFANANAIFLNTDFWTVFYPAKAALEAEGKDVTAASHTAFDAETTYGKNAAEAAAKVPTLERIVVSALGSVSTSGKYSRSLHPEAKDWIVKYIEREQAALAKKMSVVYLGAYSTNRMLVPTLDKGTGKYKFLLPIHEHTHLPVIDPQRSTGLFVRELIEDEAPGIKLLAYDSDLTIGQIVETWSRASGKEAALVPVTTQDMHKMGALWEHLDAIDFLNGHDYEASVPGIIRPPQLKTNVKTKPFEEWLKEKSWDGVLA